MLKNPWIKEQLFKQVPCVCLSELHINHMGFIWWVSFMLNQAYMGLLDSYLLRCFYESFKPQLNTLCETPCVNLGHGLAVGKNIVSNSTYDNSQYCNGITSGLLLILSTSFFYIIKFRGLEGGNIREKVWVKLRRKTWKVLILHFYTHAGFILVSF